MAGRGNFQVGGLVLRQRSDAGNMQGADTTQATTYECYDVDVITTTPHYPMFDKYLLPALDLSGLSLLFPALACFQHSQ